MELGLREGISHDLAFPRWLGSQGAIGQTVGNPLYDGCVVVLNHNMPSGIGLGVASTGSSSTPWQTVQIGAGAKAYLTGAAVGRNAFGYSSGAAVGVNAEGYTNGVAVGRTARGYSFGVAVGRTARGYTTGVAVGYTAKGYTTGVAVGYTAEGYSFGVAVGRTARGYYHGVAIGYQAGKTITASTTRTNVFVGYRSGYAGNGTTSNKFTTARYGVCIGGTTGLGSATQHNYITCVGYKTTCTAAGAFAIGCSNAGTGATSTVLNTGVLGTATHTISHPGGFQTHTVTKTGNYTMAKTDRCVLGTGTITVKVPTPVTGLECFIKNIGTGTVTVKKNGTAKIDGHTTIAMSTQYESVHLIATATQWYIVSQVATSIL